MRIGAGRKAEEAALTAVGGDERRSPRLGLALSGGGARGAAHVSLVQALRERDLRPGVLAGASAGALVAAMEACDLPVDRMLGFFREADLFRWHNLTLGRKPGLLDSDRILESLRELFGDRSLEDLPAEVRVVATDLQSGERRVLREGSVARAVMASSAVPGVMSPVEIDGRLLVDGGLIDPLPAREIRGSCEVLVGSHVNAVAEMEPASLQGSFDVLHRAFQLVNANLALEQLQDCDFRFEPAAVAGIGLFELDRVDEAHAAATRQAGSLAERIARRLRGDSD